MKDLVEMPMVSTTSVSPSSLVPDRFSIPGGFDVFRMTHVQIDVANLRAALADHHNLVWSLVDAVRLDAASVAPTERRLNPGSLYWPDSYMRHAWNSHRQY